MLRAKSAKVGVAISSLVRHGILLKDLPLADISTSMTINSTAGILLAFYIAVARKQGVSMASKGHDPKRSSERIHRSRNYIYRQSRR